MTTTLHEAGVDPTATDGEPDPEASGKLFEVPRVGVLTDQSDPTVLRLSFSGSIVLDRTQAADVEFFNSLEPGHTAPLSIEVHVAGDKKTHRRDSEGDVDAIVETRSLIVASITGVS